MKYLSLEAVIILHEDIMRTMNGLVGTHPQQIGLLDSTLNQIQNDDYYPSFLDKLTHLIFACVKFHPFLDGNKRTALYLAKAFIKLNCPQLLPKNFYQNLEEVVVELAEDKINKEKLKEILKELL